MEITMTYCGKNEHKTLLYPKRFYDNFVNRIMNTMLDIVDDVILGNGYNRESIQQNNFEDALDKCILLNHYIRVSEKKGYLTTRQRDLWVEKVNDVYVALKS